MLDSLNLTEYRLHIIIRIIYTPIRFKTIMDAMDEDDSYPVHFRNVRLIVRMNDVYKHPVVYRKLRYLLGKLFHQVDCTRCGFVQITFFV